MPITANWQAAKALLCQSYCLWKSTLISLWFYCMLLSIRFGSLQPKTTSLNSTHQKLTIFSLIRKTGGLLQVMVMSIIYVCVCVWGGDSGEAQSCVTLQWYIQCTLEGLSEWFTLTRLTAARPSQRSKKQRVSERKLDEKRKEPMTVEEKRKTHKDARECGTGCQDKGKVIVIKYNVKIKKDFNSSFTINQLLLNH